MATGKNWCTSLLPVRIILPCFAGADQMSLRCGYPCFLLRKDISQSVTVTSVPPCFFVLFCFDSTIHTRFKSECPFSAVHFQHASQVPGQQPAGAQQPSGSVEAQWSRPAGPVASSCFIPSFHRTGLVTDDMITRKKKTNVLFHCF